MGSSVSKEELEQEIEQRLNSELEKEIEQRFEQEFKQIDFSEQKKKKILEEAIKEGKEYLKKNMQNIL